MEFPFIPNDYPAPINLQLDMQTEDGRPALTSTPGLGPYCDFASTSEIRGMHTVAGTGVFVVCGASVYLVTSEQHFTLIDTLSTSTGWVWMEDNSLELLISDGANGYLYNLTKYFTSMPGGSSSDTPAVLDNSGAGWAWGDNTSGQVGDLTTDIRSSPVVVVGFHSFTELSSGLDHTMGLKANGEIWTWGDNTYGQLGDESVTARSSPVQVVGSHSFVEISGAGTSSMARKADGAVWVWGRNNQGQIGDQTTADKSSPVVVVGSHTFSKISGGTWHCIAMKADGSLWSWGDADLGQLGDDTNTDKSSPVVVVGSHTFTDVSAGGYFNIALKAGGAAWMWGSNLYGELGVESLTEKSSPVAVVGSHAFVEIIGGYRHTVARKADGTVWAWGENAYGAIGDNTITYRSSPVIVVGSHSFEEITAGYQFTMARKANASIWSWGRNASGQLGDSSTTDKSSPVVIVRRFQPLTSVGPTAMGSLTFLDGYFVTNDVDTQRWYISGLYDGTDWPDLDYTSAEEDTDDLLAVIMCQGELWAGGKKSFEVYLNSGGLDFPFSRIPGAFLDVGMAAAASLAQADNSIFWLDNNKRVRRGGGPLGYGSTVISPPPMDKELATYDKVSDAEGFTFSQGGNDYYSLTFPSVPKTWIYNVTATAHAKNHIWHQRETGSLSRWLSRCHAEYDGKQLFGDYSAGKIYEAVGGRLNDNGDAISRAYAGPLIQKDGKRIFFPAFEVEFAPVTGIYKELPVSAYQSSFALKGNGEPWALGYNTTDGQLGDNSKTNRSSPVAVVGSHSFTKIAGGDFHGLGLKSNGTAWSWGQALQLGDNTGVDKSSPVAVVGSHSFTAIATGELHSLALKTFSDTWAWGSNTSGQLGDGSKTARSSPVAVIGSHSFIQVSGGALHSGGLKSSDGSVWTWGDGASGRLGDDTATGKSSPVAVVGSHSFREITLGGDFSAARKADGITWTWGEAGSGQLGDNTKTDKSSPVAVVGSHSFKRISAGLGHMIGLKRDGTVWAWGENTYGQVGDNTVTGKSSPVAVVGSHSFVDVIATEYSCLGLKSDGHIWAWGRNSKGQLGDNAITNKSSPVVVVGAFGANAALDWINERGLWSSEHALKIPTAGDSYQRSRARRLGQDRSRRFRVTVTDPVDVTIKAAYGEIERER